MARALQMILETECMRLIGRKSPMLAAPSLFGMRAIMAVFRSAKLPSAT